MAKKSPRLAAGALLWDISGSALLPEVGETQARGGLILPLFAHGDDDEHHQGDDVGDHLVELLHRQVQAGGDVEIQDVEAAEEDGGQDADVGTPDGEDDQSDGQPAAVAEGVVGPNAVGVSIT